jgi:hypothetical protein
MGGAYSAHLGDGNAYEIVVGKPEWKSSLGISGRRWENNIKIGLDLDWINLA